MQFVHSLPFWLALLVAAIVGAAAFGEYRRPLAPLTTMQRGVLAASRILVLTALVLFLMRPVILVPPPGASDRVVPILIDVSRSMRLHDADGKSRLDGAVLAVKQLLPALSHQFAPVLFSVGDRDEPAPDLERLRADALSSHLSSALAAVRDRYRGQPIAGIVLVSDGGETGPAPVSSTASGPPIFAVGVGSSQPLHDREISGLSAGDQRLDQASVDLHVTATSAGFGRAPFLIRVLANGRELETRRVVPPADGAPIDALFTVSPDPAGPTVYTADIPADETEAVTENNTRSVLVNPAGPKRRLLIVEGAPGFEHSFLKRAWARDPGLEVDAVGRKGKNGEGQDTFFVQAAADRTAGLARGFPSTREELFAYHGVVLANVEGGFFTRAQSSALADFVSVRGGGLLIAGGRSLDAKGIAGTPLEEIVPVELGDRQGGLVRTSAPASAPAVQNKVVITPDGENHPAMRIGSSPEDTRRLWSAMPPLAAGTPIGGPRPGATVLAVASSPTGAVYPVVAVQRYGRGRSMMFAGEASWRWKMLLPAADRSYEMFWRQAARWIAGSAPDRVSISVSDALGVGDAVAIDVDVRDAAFAPVGDASLQATLTVPGGGTRPLKMRRAETSGQYSAAVTLEPAGLYRVDVTANRGSAPLGAASRWLYAGGVDREFIDPRLNDAWLRRVASLSGGRYVPAAQASQLVNWLQDTTPQQAAPERRDLWHEPWAFGIVVALLAIEWTLRRRWGLR